MLKCHLVLNPVNKTCNNGFLVHHANLKSLRRTYTPSTLPADTCDCPEGFHLCAGHCLLWVDDYTGYLHAVSLCAAHGAHLVVPRSDAELQCVRDIVDTKTARDAWLGVTDVEEEGEFVGEDGCGALTVPDAWWAGGQPNGGSDENYMASTPTGWFDSPQDNEKYPICQLNGCYKPQCL